MSKIISGDEWIEKYCESPDDYECENCVQCNEKGECISYKHYCKTGDLSLSKRYHISGNDIFKVYKIRRISDHAYSESGGFFKKNGIGKVWRKIGDVKIHITQNKDFYKENPSELITYSLEELERVKIGLP